MASQPERVIDRGRLTLRTGPGRNGAAGSAIGASVLPLDACERGTF